MKVIIKNRTLFYLLLVWLTIHFTPSASEKPIKLNFSDLGEQTGFKANGADTNYFDFYWPVSSLPILSSGQQTDVRVILENTVNHSIFYDIIIEVTYPQSGWLGVSDFEYFIESGLNNKDTGYINLNVGGILEGCENIAYVVSRLILVVDQYAFADTLHYNYIAECISLIEIDTISTGVISMAVINTGAFGLGTAVAANGGARMDYFNDPAECDTVDSIPGETEVYIYDGSIFVGSIENNDTIFACQIFGQGFRNEWSIYPLEPPQSPIIDGPIQTWSSGTMVNHDSSIAMAVTFYAPQVTQSFFSGPNVVWADQQFITRELKVWSNNDQTHLGITVGDVIDWDIPSDSGHDNIGYKDESRRLLYLSGAEYNQDDSVECQDNDQRYGGMAYGYAKLYNSNTNQWTIIDSSGYGAYHALNSEFVYPGFDAGEFYINLENSSIPCDPFPCPTLNDDLHSAQCYVFDYDLLPDDTLVFYSVLATVRNTEEEDPGTGLLRIQELADKGRNFTHYFGCCHGTKGDINNDGANANILDLNHAINYFFRFSAKLTCDGESDLNTDGKVNILDFNVLVNYIFRMGPALPSCGQAL